MKQLECDGLFWGSQKHRNARTKAQSTGEGRASGCHLVISAISMARTVVDHRKKEGSLVKGMRNQYVGSVATPTFQACIRIYTYTYIYICSYVRIVVPYKRSRGSSFVLVVRNLTYIHL